MIILCFLLTVSTAFEYKLEQDTKYKDKLTGGKCENISQMLEASGMQYSRNQSVDYTPVVLRTTTSTTSTTTEENVIEELAPENTLYDYIDGQRMTRQTPDYNRSTVDIEERLNSCQVVRHLKKIQSFTES